MLSVVENLASGIRLRQHRTIEYALDQGASPNAVVHLERHERFGADQAPIIYLAIHYDLPGIVQDLLRLGADTKVAIEPGLTPRAHAAWRFRWECLDAFDMDGIQVQDHEMVLSAILSHWCERLPHPDIERMFFKRVEHLPKQFEPSADLAFRMLIGVFCGAVERAGAAHRLLANGFMHNLGARVRQGMQDCPARFIPHLSQWSQLPEHRSHPHNVTDDTIAILAHYDIDIAMPDSANINPESAQWLNFQQARIDAMKCRQHLSETTPLSNGESKRGRL